MPFGSIRKARSPPDRMGTTMKILPSELHTSRTAWHTHPVGQTLHVLDGLGLVQSAGHAPQVIRPGDTVSIAAHERHWHGAAPGRTMTHLAIQETDEHGSDVVWLEHVTDDEYSQPPI